MIYYFYDTCSLLLDVENLFTSNKKIVISSITLNELENIKTSANKDTETKYNARKLLHLFENNPDKYECWIFRTEMLQPIEEKALAITDDTRILATALDYDKTQHPDDTIFITNDLALKHIANLFFGTDSIISIDENPTEYAGYIDLKLDNNEMADFYSHPTENIYDLYVNEYLNIYDMENNLVDTLRWTGEEYKRLNYHTFESRWLGSVKAYKGDIYQAMLCDSLVNNQITMVRGSAGSGKTYLSLAYLLHLLDKGKIDKIIVFCNTVATKNSARLGLIIG